MGVKIAVVGGGSTYTPELVEGFVRRADRLPIDELVLLDIDAERLSIVGGLAQRMLDRLDWVGRLTQTGDRESAIDGADFVLIQLRVGGQATRLIDETLPPRFGVIGQETTGAGGFAKALRTVPVGLDLAELTARRAAPGAWPRNRNSWRTAAGRITARLPPSSSPRCTTGRATSRSSTCATMAPCPIWPTARSWRSRRGSIVTALTPRRWRRSHPRCAASSRRPRPTKS